MSELVWDVLTCPYCGAEVPLGIMSLVAVCDCGAWYAATPSNPRLEGWHRQDEVIG